MTTTKTPVLVQDEMTIWFASEQARDAAAEMAQASADDLARREGLLVDVDTRTGGPGARQWGFRVEAEADADIDLAIEILSGVGVLVDARMVGDRSEIG